MSHYCRECLHDEVCSLTHCGQSIACCNFVNAERYHEIMQAEREGRLVTLFCNPGTKLYSLVCCGIGDWRICESVLVEVVINKVGIAYRERRDDGYVYSCHAELFGKTVFLSRELAEEALEEANGPA